MRYFPQTVDQVRNPAAPAGLFCSFCAFGRKIRVDYGQVRQSWVIGFCLLVLLAGGGCNVGNQQQLQEALRELEAGDYAGAARHLERVTARDPQNATAHGNLGIAYWKLGSTDQAAAALIMASDLEPNDPRPLLLLVEVFQDASRWDEAREVLARIGSGQPDRPDLLTRRACLDYRAGQIEQAVTNLENALKLDAGYAPALYDMAVVARDQRHDMITAMRYFSRFLTVATNQVRIDKVNEELARLRQPFRPVVVPPTPSPAPPVPIVATPVPTSEPTVSALLEQTRLAIRGQAYDEALVLLGRVREREPRNPDALLLTAGLYDQQLGQPRRARELLTEFVALFPSDPRADAARRRLNVLTVASVTNTTTTTTIPPPPTTTTIPVELPVESPAAPVSPAPIAALSLQEAWKKGLEAHDVQRWADAIQYYEAALAADPKFARAAYNMGIAYKAQGDLVQSQAAFSRAVEIDPRLDKALYMLAVVYREQGERDAALTYAKNVLAINPKDHRAHYLLGLLYRDALRYDLARQHFKKALQLAPDRDAASKARIALNSMPAPKETR